MQLQQVSDWQHPQATPAGSYRVERIDRQSLGAHFLVARGPCRGCRASSEQSSEIPPRHSPQQHTAFQIWAPCSPLSPHFRALELRRGMCEGNGALVCAMSEGQASTHLSSWVMG